ncbi:flavodoxin [Lacrimispora indolis]|uniref:flavodoxin n=1 Tax=Lacrimispora indolis TaxID=69825 RepID=UPI000462A7E8|nr:flavodoxin [[Clostridium] methoxybenzovorans]
MKKLSGFITVFLLSSVLLAGCGSNSGSKTGTATTEGTASQSTQQTEVSKDTESADKPRILVAYYSASGTTEKIADTIVEKLGADVFVIEPADPYTDEDLNYRDDNSRVYKEHDNPDTRHVELVTTDVEGFNSYDTIFIGYPIWWQSASWVVDDFVKNNDFTGKTVIPFCTSASSSIGESGNELAAMAGTGNWLKGERFSSQSTDEEIAEWLESVHLK